MSWFQLDPASIATRAQANGATSDVPSLKASLLRGVIGFTFVSVAGFAPWAFAGRWFSSRIGEAGLYAVCAVMFIGLSGLVLHRLIIGRGSLVRLYKLFSIAFTAYSIAWIVGWMSLRGHAGSFVGLLAGTAVMGWLLTLAFDAKDTMWKVIAALFILNALGYFFGGWAEGGVMAMKEFPLGRRTQRITAMLLWGVFFGIGLGAGLGLAFYNCQTSARALLLNRKSR